MVLLLEYNIFVLFPPLASFMFFFTLRIIQRLDIFPLRSYS